MLEFERVVGLRKGPATLAIDIVDYPGEWLLDLPLLEKSFAQWSRETLAAAATPARAPLAADWAQYVTAIDPAGKTDVRVTLMTAPGADAAVRDSVAALCRDAGRQVSVIADSPGFVAQRVVAMVVNLACEIAQMQLADPASVDKAYQLALAYPMGPLAMADAWGVKRIYDVLTTVQQITGDDRYRPSQWLRRRALLGLSALTPA